MSIDRRAVLRSVSLALSAVVAPSAWAGGSDSIVSDDDGQVTPGNEGGNVVIEGKVRSYAGWPIAGATIGFESLDSPPNLVPEIGLMTNSRGYFRFELPAGTYRVTAVSPAGHRKRRVITLRGRSRWTNFWLPR